MARNQDESQVNDLRNQTPENVRYPREELLLNVEALFNVKKEVLLGALHRDERQGYSIDEVHALIKDFMKRRVI